MNAMLFDTTLDAELTIRMDLHRKLLDKYADDTSVQPLIEMWPAVSNAILKVLEDGDYESYICAIRAYDEYIWKKSKEPDGSNPIAYKKWKIYPSWSELNWAIVYERVRRQLSFETVLIRTDKVLEGATTNGDIFYKDVDGGLAIPGMCNGKKVLFPVVVMEHKGGHFCKTACTGVNAIGRRFHDTNPNVLTVQATENKVTIGLDQSDALIRDIDIFIIDRGKNKVEEDKFWERNANEMLVHEQDLLKKLSLAKPQHFTSIKKENVSSLPLRLQLNETNYISKEKVFIDFQ